MSWAQRVRKQYENIAFHDGEDFALHLAKMVHELEILGDPEEPRKVAAKYLRIVPKRFVPVAVSIESVLDTANMSIEEITSRLRAVKGQGDEEEADPPTGAGGKLLLIEEQWLARMKDKQPGEGSSKSGADGGKNRPHNQKKKKKKNASAGGDDGSGGKYTCHNCSKKGHWAKECRAPLKEQASLTREDDEESLLMARVCEINDDPTS
jgi:hypothetical protein